MKKASSARRSTGGFTLIELLVVELIIGGLAAIAVPQYFKVVGKGKVGEAFAAAGSIPGAQERCLAARGDYDQGVDRLAMKAGRTPRRIR